MTTRLFIIFCLTVFFAPIFGEDTPTAENSENYIQNRYLVILGSYKDFHAAHQKANTISTASKTIFSMQGRVYDEKRGLILPDNDPDISYAGTYLERRYNTNHTNEEYLSIEKSEAYEGFIKDYYIIVAGIYEDQSSAEKSLKRYRTIVPKAYIKKTKIYMGCIH